MKILKHYHAPTAESTLKSLNKLCLCLVFCIYAEDAGIFEWKNQAHDHLAQTDIRYFRQALADLFKILDSKVEDHDSHLVPELTTFL